MRPFVNAVWSDIVLFTYAVPISALQPYLGRDLTLDLHRGQAYVSIAGFRFQHTRVLGWSAPYPSNLCNFPQFNLRFYVCHGKNRGVVFLSEFVPSPAVAQMVRFCYNEPYHAAPLSCRATQVGDLRRVRYDLAWRGKRYAVAVTARAPACAPEPGSLSEFFTEQDYGYGRSRTGQLTRFRVVRPAWREYEVESHFLRLDFGGLFGPQWEFLQDRVPDSVVLFEGSAIEVYPNETL